MSSGMIFTLIVFGLIALLFIVFMVLYNNLVKKRNEINNAFGSIDAMLKKRYDLIPNLVETVKAYMSHEASILSEVTRLRSNVDKAASNDEIIDSHNKLTRSIDNLLMVAESYPQLKASQNFRDLQASWNEAEEQIAASRRYYNTAVTLYNNAVLSFPSNLIALWFGFKPMMVFQIPDSERQNISAKELFKKNE